LQPIQVWHLPEPDRTYVVGVDPGFHIDNSAIEVICFETGEQCAEWAGMDEPASLCKLVDEIGRAYNNALVVVEANGMGVVVISMLQEVLRYPNLYSRGGYLGWTTTRKTKAIMDKAFKREGLDDDRETALQIAHAARIGA
jgi:hypothetical protein